MAQELFHGYVALQARGTISIPAVLRKAMRLDEPGAQIELTQRDDGVVEMRAALPIPEDEAWFWTQEWQAGEREADEDIKAGRTKKFDSIADAVKYLESL